MPFEWDHRKARSNEAKHGVAFGEAQLAFDDPNAFVAPDARHSTQGEHRQRLIGDTGGRLVVVTFTERDQNRFRIISTRQAGRRDRRKYAANKRDSLPLGPGPKGDG